MPVGLSSIGFSNPFGIMELVNADRLKTQRLGGYEATLERAEGKHTRARGALRALFSLKNDVFGTNDLGVNFPGVVGDIKDLRIKTINPKVAISIATSDTGSGADYFTAATIAGANTLASLNITVNQVATTSTLIVDKSYQAVGGTIVNTSFGQNELLDDSNIEDITINCNGGIVGGAAIALDPNGTIFDAANTINANAAIQAVGLQAKVVSMGPDPANPGTNLYKLVISSTTSGVAAGNNGIITATYNGGANFGGNNLIVMTNNSAAGVGAAIQGTAGQNASITALGQNYTSTSNKFGGPLGGPFGVTITVKKPNTTHNNVNPDGTPNGALNPAANIQTVTMKPDVQSMAQSTIDIIDRINEVLTKLAKEQQRDKDHKPAEGANLVDSRAADIIRRILINGVTTMLPPGSAFSSLASIGIIYKGISADDRGPERGALVVDERVFNRALNEQGWEAIQNLLYNNVAVTPVPGTTSTLSYKAATQVLPANVIGGQQLTIAVPVVAGVPNGVTVDFNNGAGPQAIGTLNGGTITFADGSPLAGVSFNYEPGAGIVAAQSFNVTITQGIFDQLANSLSNTALPVVNIELDQDRTEVKRADSEVKRAREDLGRRREKLDVTLAGVRVQAYLAEQTIQMFQALMAD